MGELLRRLRYFLRRRRLDDELQEELAFHRELTRQALETEGVDSDGAAIGAQRALGNDALARNQARDVWVWPWLQDISQDIRFAARLLAKDRRFTLAAVIALALGIGVTNTVFTIVNTAAFRDLPFEEPNRLVSVATRDPRGREAESYLDFRDMRDAATMFSGMAATVMAFFNLSDEGRAPDRLMGTFVSANTFRVLRAQPMLGRDFLPEDDRPGAPPVVIISYGVWQVRYGGDPTVIGRSVRINGTPATIVGVMPPRFGFPAFQDAWQPLALMPGLETMTRDARRLMVFGRLSDLADLAAARSEIETLVARLAEEYPDTNKGSAASVARLRDRLPDSWPILWTLIGAVGFVLFIACANVANLLLARSVNRSREIAIRASLGATRWRIVRQLLIECVLLASVAGALGLLLSVYGVKLLGVAFDAIDVANPMHSNTPYWVDLSMNTPVFLFVAGLCLFTGVAFGLVPALHVSKTDVHDTLKDGGRGGVGGRHAQRWTGAFVTAQLALTLVLLTGAGLLWRNFLIVYRAAPVIDASDLVVMRLGLPVQRYAGSKQLQAFYALLDERLAARSTLLRATIAGFIPYGTLGSTPRRVAVEGRPPVPIQEAPLVTYAAVGPRYFETVGLPMLRGRAIGARDDRPAQEGAIVDQRFVARFFPDENPLGQRVQLSSTVPQPVSTPWLTIVGVVPSVDDDGPGRSAEQPMVYVPMGVEPTIRTVALFVRRTVASERGAGRHVAIGDDRQMSAMVSAVRDDVRALDPDLPIFGIEPMDDVLARSRFSNRLIGTWFGMLAGIALVLASVGLFAVTAHSVASRTQEIGVRMALGAQASWVVWLFVRRSIVQLAIGLTLGVGGALATGQLLQSWLTRTDPRDVPTLVTVSAVLVTIAIVACIIPARRAAKLDPVTALRQE